MASGLFDTLATGAIDLGLAEVVQPDAGTLVVVARANPTRYALAVLCLAVAAFTGWHTWREYTAIGPLGLWPGIAIVPVFGALMLALMFFEQQKRFDARTRTAVLSGRFLGLASRFDHPLPAQGEIRLSASIELTRSEPSGVRRIYTYHVDIADDAALGFTLKGNRDAATAFAARLAQVLNYRVVDDLEPDEASSWHAVPIVERRY